MISGHEHLGWNGVRCEGHFLFLRGVPLHGHAFRTLELLPVKVVVLVFIVVIQFGIFAKSPLVQSVFELFGDELEDVQGLVISADLVDQAQHLLQSFW